ncbi:ATP-binding cassette domain-containing protein, partial [Stenotrophomonas maltophilia]|uniref:ATP-binding cassette domain-containing protein n=1 Tax=Stenotrophomonas maltophilia TaxID=40324 RepID=UPI002250D917|nr:ATP-binding cassette domain-containing protein [Stenotrophomonas maltophilia]
MSQPLLAFNEVDVFYGPIQALKQVSLTVNEGETVALIGANGAGKSTLLMSVFGQPRIAGGGVFYRREAASRVFTPLFAPNALPQAPGGRRLFPPIDRGGDTLLGADSLFP